MWSRTVRAISPSSRADAPAQPKSRVRVFTALFGEPMHREPPQRQRVSGEVAWTETTGSGGAETVQPAAVGGQRDPWHGMMYILLPERSLPFCVAAQLALVISSFGPIG